MKLAQLVSQDCVSALQKMRSAKPPARLAFRFLQEWDRIEPILRRYEEQRIALLRKYARGEDGPDIYHFRNEDGSVDQDAVGRFLAEHAELLEEEVGVEPFLTLEELEQFWADLTVSEYAAIRWMVREDAGASADS